MSATFRLNLLELESRVVPSWWTITAPTIAEGVTGSTDATHIGSVNLNSDYPQNNGAIVVWGDTAIDAVTEALSGTITVTFNGKSHNQVFGTDTVGVQSDGKAFAVAVNNTNVTINFEDMVGFPGVTPDYDYNDRSWTGGTMATTSSPVLYNSPTTLSSPFGVVTVTTTVTAEDKDTFKWNYNVYNNSFNTEGWGRLIGSSS